jgi:hypothetical protein
MKPTVMVRKDNLSRRKFKTLFHQCLRKSKLNFIQKLHVYLDYRYFLFRARYSEDDTEKWASFAGGYGFMFTASIDLPPTFPRYYRLTVAYIES